MFWLNNEMIFPPISQATSDGIVALGGDLRAARLLLAYRSGIFPWYEEGSPILWWSPDPRMVLFPQDLKVSKSMRQFLRKSRYYITENQAFEQVISHCAKVARSGQEGTWITQDMQAGYLELHRRGIAKSVEVWEDHRLVAGLYGVDLGHVFCGESMFSLRPNASKQAFVYLVRQLDSKAYKLIDCQVYTDHLASLGAKEIPREVFLSYL
ncbi:MAG: leucyl/phenylalanyl-tRNA--protein transferase [Flavobacteriaceae bacterium]|nr:leucyl/phenylalanyl-tRNA--protein transferase [Flavobacteriaceae bacterium]